MKRIGHLMKQMLTEENFIRAEVLLGKNKPDNKQAKYIARHSERFGKALLEEVKQGYVWHTPRQTTIVDSYKGKTRNLRIPCLKDQAVQLAWLNIAIPYIERRNYFYNCGSIPQAGQTRCVKALKKWLKNPRVKYGATTDIRKFYETCPHWTIRKGLERIFKDKEFVDFAMGFVNSMTDTDVGIAIGYPSSHWLANVVLMSLDHEVRRQFPDVYYTRYMDDIAMVSSNKRHLRKAVDLVKKETEGLGMHLKKWSLFKIKDRGLTFLSYRFFNGYSILTKGLAVRISRRAKRASKTMNAHVAMGIVSYFGILKHCNSYNFRKKYIYTYVNKQSCIRLIRLYAARKELYEAGYGCRC